MTKMQNSKLSFILTGLALWFAIATPAAGQSQNGAHQPSLDDASPQGSMAIYQDYTRYPPDSRPLNASNWDLLHPWLTETASLPMVPIQVASQMASLRASGLPEDEVWRSVAMPPLPRYQFAMNKDILAGTQDELQAILTITPASGSDAPLRIHIIKAELIGDDAFGAPHLGAVPFSCKSEEPICVFQWKAPAPQTKYWGVLDLVVTVTVEGASDNFVIHQPFYSSPIVAGTFTGDFQERIADGSLLIEAGVKVQKHMACFVSANLYSADKEIPTHHAERRMIVDPSMKTIGFTFFGKIFRDNGHEGVFRLQDLKAQCENLSYPPEWFLDSLAYQAELAEFQNNPPATREPTRIYFAYNPLTYTTQRYAGNTFSSREWQSPERARKLNAFKNADAELNDPAKEIRKRALQQSPQH
ncbi:MAG TPA: hypothetical protein VKY85_11550 [Candidatus Angelobacter sp.]|nr:hypothetical protein [Candidatus Angelobacter sp.]